MGFMGIRDVGGNTPAVARDVAPGRTEYQNWMYSPLLPPQLPCEAYSGVRELLVCFSEFYGLDIQKVMRVARCESGLNPLAKSKTSSASGVFQFIDSTFRSTLIRHRDHYRFPDHHVSVFDPYWNVRLATWKMSVDGYGAWVCK